ncbi:MAG: hypothetical protein GEU79_14580 [Acidimicrobiia bacterium]|nr:hypothetical protein [Acidimicrobiia bacterium]
MILVAVVSVALAAVSLLAFFGDQWWILDLVASFRPQLALAVGVGAGLLLMARWWRTGVAVAVVAAINLAVVVPVFMGEPAEGPGSIRIMSYNLLASNEDFAEVVDFIERTDADVVVLHEASRPWEVALGSAGLDYQVTRSRTEDLIFGTVVLTRDPVEITSYGFSAEEPRAIEISLYGISILAIHPLAPSTEERIAIRNGQFAWYTDWVTARSGDLIVVGDFNATPWSHPFRQFVADTGLANSQNGFGLELSYPARSIAPMQVSIDHLLHSDGLGVVRRELGPPMGSDHLPLIVDLTRN